MRPRSLVEASYRRKEDVEKSNLKRPLQALLVSPDTWNREEIARGVITATIRDGHRDYRNGQVMLCCHIVPWVLMAQIIKVRHITLEQLLLSECSSAGFQNTTGAHEELLKFYPHISFGSPVTYIRWDKIEGRLSQT